MSDNATVYKKGSADDEETSKFVHRLLKVLHSDLQGNEDAKRYARSVFERVEQDK
jgi:hypothetical protein